MNHHKIPAQRAIQIRNASKEAGRIKKAWEALPEEMRRQTTFELFAAKFLADRYLEQQAKSQPPTPVAPTANIQY